MRNLLVAFAALMTVALGGCGSATVPVAQTPPLEKAWDTCSNAGYVENVTLADSGSSIIIDTGGEYGSYDGVACIFMALDTPEYVVSSVEHTTALMGSQTATANGLVYHWSYHPDNGLNMTISEE